MLFHRTGKTQRKESGIVKGFYFSIFVFMSYLDESLFRYVIPEFNKYGFWISKHNSFKSVWNGTCCSLFKCNL